MVSKQVNWTGFLITLIGAVAVVVVWAYSTFVTRSERDAMREIYNQRLVTVEGSTSRLLESNAGLSGKMDSMVLMIQNLHNNDGGKRR